MVTRRREPPAGPFRVRLRAPRAFDSAAFIAAVKASRKLHGSWVRPPDDEETFAAFVRRYAVRSSSASHAGYLAVRIDDGALVGAFNFSQIVRGALQSAFLGYYAFAPHAGNGLMSEAFVLALDSAFGPLGLHRVEVNVQPENARSLRLVERMRFEREGYSRRYVKVAGRWRDHVRFAMLAEDWPARRRETLAILRELGGA